MLVCPCLDYIFRREFAAERRQVSTYIYKTRDAPSDDSIFLTGVQTSLKCLLLCFPCTVCVTETVGAPCSPNALCRISMLAYLSHVSEPTREIDKKSIKMLLCIQNDQTHDYSCSLQRETGNGSPASVLFTCGEADRS